MKKRNIGSVIFVSLIFAAVISLCLCADAQSDESCGYVVKLSDNVVSLFDLSGGYDPLASLGYMSVPDEQTAKEMVENGFGKSYFEDAPVELFTESYQPVDSQYNLQYAPAQIFADKVWKMGFYGEGIKVAIVDSGANSHVDLDERIIDRYNVFSQDSDVTDDHGHGTHVAGSACAGINGKCVVGIAPKCDIAIVKAYSTSGNGMTRVAAGIVYAAEVVGADVINVSIGGTKPAEDSDTIESFYILQAAVERAEECGSVVCAAVGNYGNTTSELMYPATFDDVIGVGAIDSNGNHFYHSRVNDSVDIMAGGRSVYSCASTGTEAYTSKNGTSMASPAVAGAVALLLNADPSLTPEQVRSILFETATDYGAEGYDTTFGHGVLNIEKAVRSVIKDDFFLSKGTVFTINDVTKEYYSVNNNTQSPVSVAAASYESGKMSAFFSTSVPSLDAAKFSRSVGDSTRIKFMFLKDLISFSPLRTPLYFE